MVQKITWKGLEKYIGRGVLVRIGNTSLSGKLTHFTLYKQPKYPDELTVEEQAFMDSFCSYGVYQPFHVVYKDIESQDKHTYILNIEHGTSLKLPAYNKQSRNVLYHRQYKLSLPPTDKTLTIV